MAARRARLGFTNALAWLAFSLAGTALTTDALARSDGALMLALGVAAAIAGAALALLTPAAVTSRTRLVLAGSLALLACAAGGALALLEHPPHLAIVAALGIAAGLQTSAITTAAAADASLAPRVRPAPTLLAAAVGAALTAMAVLLPSGGIAIALIVAAGLQLIVIALAVAAAEPRPAATDGPRAAAPASAPIAPPSLLALLAIAAAGAGALAALRPSLSAIGADAPSPAGPLAIMLAIGALLGPPLAMLADRLGTAAPATLAVVGGATALVAPIARPGVLDVIAAVVLGVALATVVALAELARRAEQRLAAGAAALVVLGGAAGAGIAGMLLTAVPVPDVALGAAMICLVAGVGVWAPGVRARQPADAGQRLS